MTKDDKKKAPTPDEIVRFQQEQRQRDAKEAEAAREKIEKDDKNWFHLVDNIFDGEMKELWHCKLTGSYKTKPITKKVDNA